MIDIGVNFHSPQLAGIGSELIERAHAAGVTEILATGVSLQGSQQALAFAQAHDRVWSTAGVHPHSAKEWNNDTSAHLDGLWSNPKVVAVGECGLDYCRMFSPKEAQRAAFEAQIAAAVARKKPLFLHCRDAFEDFHAMLVDASDAGAHGVVHCFTGSAQEAEAYLALGFDLGITGWVTDEKRGQALRSALAVIPVDRLHLETDAPYLRPRNAGKTRSYNEPALLPFVAQAVAALKRMDAKDLSERAAANSRRLFGLPA